MPKRKKSFLKKRQYRVILLRTMTALIVLNAVAILFFLSVIQMLMGKNQEQEDYRTNLSLLEQADHSMKQMLSLMEQNMNQIIWNSDVVHHLVDPYGFDGENGNRIFNLLQDCVDSVEFVDAAYLYSPFSKEAYCDTGKILPKDQIRFREILDLNPSRNDKVILSEKRTTLNMENFDNHFYLILDFYPGERIGSLIYQLNAEHVYHLIQDPRWEGEDVFLLNDQGEIFIGKESRNRKEISLSDLQNANRQYQGTEFSYVCQLGDTSFCVLKSEFMDWYYIRPIEISGVFIEWRVGVTYALPVLLVFFIVSAILSIWISRRIYEPINRLMNLTANQNEKGEKHFTPRSETDYLELAYLNVLSENEQITEAMQNVRKDILEQLLHGLVIGKNMDSSHVMELLNSAGTPFEIQGRFVVLCFSISENDGSENNSLQMGLYRASIGSILEQIVWREGNLYCFSVDSVQVVALFVGNKEQSAWSIKQTLAQGVAVFMEKMRTLPFQCTFGQGSICNSLLDIHESYREAFQDINRKVYGEINQEGNEGAEDTKAEVYGQLAEQIVRKMLEGNRPEAERKVDLLIEEVSREAVDLEEKKILSERLIDSLMERIWELQMDSDDSQLVDVVSFSHGELYSVKNVPELERYIRNICYQLLGVLGIYAKNKTIRYITMAKDYIRMNYSDMNMSRDSIGDYIGISGAYLGQIFRDATGENLLDYLNSYRIEKAKKLLNGTKLPAKEIGYKCGFASAQSFIRVFKKYTGVTPGQYRN
ncbi:helix-turn-helix domain-containing protein [Hominifimenecus sp. rT4P-3]|uniref:helix-turn-helix domain-containing protein n=1 Tax=Hominifimenecus sp. rT4P-3 TaxID=3242979 RepID=UPI003DA31376